MELYCCAWARDVTHAVRSQLHTVSAALRMDRAQEQGGRGALSRQCGRVTGQREEKC